MCTIKNILDAKGAGIHAVARSNTVLDAIERMCDAQIGALLVTEHDFPLGIVSERDVMMRVLLLRRDPSTTRVGAIMSTDLVCIDLEASAETAMSLMTTRRCRHLPVVYSGRVVGIVSMGDLVNWAIRDKDYEIRTLREYVSGVCVS